MKSFIAAAFAVVVLAVQGSAQQAAAPQQPPAAQLPPATQLPPPPVFRVQVDAVEIDAFVTDALGNPVTDLTADDFEILEDNRPQAITSFSLVDIPVERAERPLYSPTAIEPDVFNNRGGEGRIYVIALDEVRPDLALRTRHFLRRFIERSFGANDIAAIVHVGRGRASDAQDFTSSRRLLLNTIDKYSGGFSQEALPAAGSEAGQAAVDAFAQSRANEAEFLDRARMRSLRDLLEFMGGLRGRRKAMIYVTERLGDIYSVLDYNGGARSLAFDDLHRAMTAATRGNVSIYPVDPRGLSPDGGLGADEVAPTAPGAEGLARVQELRAFAEATGGFALVNSNNFDQAFERIVRENSSYYVLGFTSTNERRDGRYRRIQVRVRRPGLQVRARNGYVAPIGRAPRPEAPDPTTSTLSASVAEAVRVPMGNPAVPMSVSAVPLKGNGRDASVAIAVEFDASRLDLAETGTTVTGEIELAPIAVGIDGKTHTGERQRARLNLRPETYEHARARGLRMLTQITLPPGRYQLRVAGGNVTGRAGSVMADLDVPDFTREPLMLSGVALTSESTAGIFTAAQKDPLAGLLPGPATATREFPRGERVALYAEVYENRRDRAAHTVTLKAELRSDEGRVLRTVEEERKSTELEGSSGGYGFRPEIALDVEPGLYVIHIEARANISGQPTASRDIQIRVK
jgi:VWFA-related protein